MILGDGTCFDLNAEAGLAAVSFNRPRAMQATGEVLEPGGAR